MVILTEITLDAAECSRQYTTHGNQYHMELALNGIGMGAVREDDGSRISLATLGIGCH